MMPMKTGRPLNKLEDFTDLRVFDTHGARTGAAAEVRACLPAYARAPAKVCDVELAGRFGI